MFRFAPKIAPKFRFFNLNRLSLYKLLAMRYRFLTLFLWLVSAFDLNAQIIQHPKLPTPQVVDYNTELPVDQYKNIFNKLAQLSENSQWQLINSISDQLNQTHRRYQQYFKGIRVELGIGITHANNTGIFRINGDFIPESWLKGNQQLNEKQALDKALSLYPSDNYYWLQPGMNEILKTVTKNPDTSYFPKASLVYCSKNFKLDTIQQLCYQFKIYSSKPLFGKSVYISAETGELVAEQNLILHTEVTGSAVTAYSGTRSIQTDSTAPGNYRLREFNRGNGILTLNMKKGTVYGNAVDFTDADNTWNNNNADKDHVATDAHWGAEMTHDYFQQEHGRNSFDNNGATIYSFIHYDVNMGNAFWNGSVMTYGDGDPSTILNVPLTSLDVCGHEIAHAVTNYSADLVYQDESGQLNESFSDIFGQSIEIWSRPLQWSWKIGEDITSTGNGIRNMQNPNLNNQPKYYKGNLWYSGTGDYGGVHYNSGVQNYWFYLITSGASGTNEVGNTFNISQLGLTKSAAIAYRNLTAYLTKSSTHADARLYSIISTGDLYGTCSPEVINVTNAWWVCGVGAKYDSALVTTNFRSDTLKCKAPATINFTNLSVNAKNAGWKFGDGNTSNTYSPSHTYNSYGKYTVSLIAESCFKNKYDTTIATIHIDSTFDICEGVLLPKKGSSTSNQCHGFVYDDGGENNYGPSKIVKLTLQIPGADSIRYRFNELDYENGFDSLVMFHTDTTQAKKIGRFTGTTLPFAGKWQKTTSNTLIFKQYSDPMVEGKGFKLEYIAYRPTLSVKFATDSITICYGDSALLNPTYTGTATNPDVRFYYPSGITKSNVYVKPQTTTSYIFTVHDPCLGITSRDTFKVKVRAPLNINLGADTNICSGQSYTINAISTGGIPASYAYKWSNSSNITSSASLTPTDSTSFYVILKDGCSIPDTANFNLGVYKPLSIDLSSVSGDICPGTLVNLTTIARGGRKNQYVYTWTPTVGSPGAPNQSEVINDSITYVITLSDGCSTLDAVDSTVINIPAPLVLSPKSNDTILCHGQSLDINLTAAGGNSSAYSLTWNDPSLTGYTFNLVPPVGNNYYEAVLSDGCMPNDTVSFNAEMREPLKLSGSLNDQVFCLGETLELTYFVSGGDASKYQLTFDTFNLNPLFNFRSFNPDSSKVYTLKLSDGCSLDTLLDFPIAVSPSSLKIQTVRFDSTMCWYEQLGRIDIDYAATNEPVTTQWRGTISNAKSITNLDSGTYSVVISDTFGCADSMSYRINKFFPIIKTGRDTTIHRGTRAFLWVTKTQSQSWYGDAILTSPSRQTIFVNPIVDTFYTVDAIDINGCDNNDTVWVWVITPPDYKIQNIISPNGDGKNETWNLTPLDELNQFRITIMDRQGALIYQTEDYQNDWKAETADGTPLPNGVYYFHLQHLKKPIVHKGFIQVIR